MKKRKLLISVVLLYLIIYCSYQLLSIFPQLGSYLDPNNFVPAKIIILVVMYLLLLVSCIIFSVLAFKFSEIGRKGIVIVEFLYIIHYILGLSWVKHYMELEASRTLIDIGSALIIIIFFSLIKIREVFQ